MQALRAAQRHHQSLPYPLEREESDSNSQSCADAVKDFGTKFVHKTQPYVIESKFVWDEHGQEEQRETDDGQADFGVFDWRKELGVGPGAKEADRKAANIPVGHDGDAKQEDQQTSPPGKVENVTDRAHGRAGEWARG